MVAQVAVLDANTASRLAFEYGDDPDAAQLLSIINRRKNSIDAEQSFFAELCDRWDNLYYPQHLTLGGADHWPQPAQPGKTHISLNVYPVYVDLPAALEAVPPVENMKPSEATEEARDVAVLGERLYFAWKDDIDFELKAHRAAITKGLYGRTAAKVFWDAENDRPDFTVIDQPRNLWLGWSNSDYTKLDWALYIYRITPEEAMAKFGVEVSAVERDGTMVPLVKAFDHSGGSTIPTNAQAYDAQHPMQVEVYDYWCRQPAEVPTLGQPTKMETWNAIYVGNIQVQWQEFEEYGGAIPFVPVFNTYVPGLPDGRSAFYDIEQLIRDKDERLSQRSQFLHQVVAGQYWQLVGPEAPDVVPPNLRPQANRVLAPGAGNRVENITPFFAGFEVEQHLDRLDRELADVSGLNDLLRGQAPSAVLSSSKAISALVANYETRIRMPRDMFYKWRADVWSLTNRVWAAKSGASDLGDILQGSRVLMIEPPSLTPRDDMEAATMSANLVSSKLWSQRRAMDRVGVEDPEQEQDLIREERTDATMFPADVQVQAQLLALLQQMGLAANPQAQAQAQQAGAQLGGMGLGGAGTPPVPPGQPALNAPAEQPVGPGGPAEAAPPAPGGETGFLAQTAIRGGEPVNRLLSQTQFGEGSPGG